MSIFEGKKALIIEDDLTAIKVMQQLLEQVAIPAIVIEDSYKVPEQLANIETPDVIFLDLEMPKSNGYTVLEYLQKDSRFEHVPIVAYTTHISHLNEAQRAGFHSFLGKPVDGDRFVEHLENILQGKPVWEVPS